MDLPSSLSRVLTWFRRLGRNLYFWGGIGALVLAAGIVYVTFDFFVMPSYTRHDVSISVPNVEKMTVEKAREELTAQGLQVEEQEGRYNPNVPRGLVVDQSPPPSSGVKPGRRVYLTINTGEVPTVQIPDLTGTSLREARNRISSIGLKVGNVREDSIPSPYPQTVTRQRPEAGDSLSEGKTVDLWYSTGLGDETVRVPALVGLRVDRAQQRLLRQKLRSVVVGDRGSDGNGEGGAGAAQGGSGGDGQTPKTKLFVREQSRSPGASVRTGTEIRLFTTRDSSAARSQRRQMPDSVLTPPSPAPDTAAVDTASVDTTSADTTSRIGF
jgi:beta-lactam-binding protein with PASTA domain